jgi:hypothetical protein
MEGQAFTDSRLEKSTSYVAKAATRSAEAITDALEVYRKAAGAEGGELKRIALRKEFTIVLDTSRRMLWLVAVILIMFAASVILATVGSDRVTATGATLAVGVLGLLVLVFVHIILFAFAQSDQKTHSEVVTYNIGQTIAVRLLSIDTMQSFMRELAAFTGEFAGDTGAALRSDGRTDEKATIAKQRIEDFIKRVALDHSLQLFGLHKIKKKRDRLEWSGYVLVTAMVVTSVAAVVMSGIAMARAFGLTLAGSERLALDDVLSSADGGASWSRGSPAFATLSQGEVVSPLGEVLHAPFGPRSHFGFATVGDGSVIVAGGAAPSGQDGNNRAAYADVWRGSLVPNKGWVQWENVVSRAPWDRRWGHAMASYRDTVMLVGGRRGLSDALLKDVWLSTDGGLTWAQRPDFPGDARFLHSMVAGLNRRVDGQVVFVLVGGSGGDKRLPGQVWQSTDLGQSWRSVGNAGAQPFGTRHGAGLALQTLSPTISSEQVAEIKRRLPLDADRTVDTAVVPDAQLALMSQADMTRLMASVNERARVMRFAWDGGNDSAVAVGSLLGLAFAAGQTSPSAEAKATEAQLLTLDQMLGTELRITSLAHRGMLTKAHYETLIAYNDVPPGTTTFLPGARTTMLKELDDIIKTPRIGTLVLAGGAASSSGRRAPITVFTSQDAGRTWSTVSPAQGSAMPTERRGHSLIAQAVSTNAERLVLVGGVQTASGDDQGRPLGDVWVSGDGGATWQRVGGGPSRMEQISSAPYDMPRRAYFGLATTSVSGGASTLIVVGGDATGMPRDERKAAGIVASGVNEGVDENVLGAKLSVDTQWLVWISGGLVVIVALVALLLHWFFYKPYYEEIPNSYVNTEKAWRDALDEAAKHPEKFEVPGTMTNIAKAVTPTLRSLGKSLRSVGLGSQQRL